MCFSKFSLSSIVTPRSSIVLDMGSQDSSHLNTGSSDPLVFPNTIAWHFKLFLFLPFKTRKPYISTNKIIIDCFFNFGEFIVGVKDLSFISVSGQSTLLSDIWRISFIKMLNNKRPRMDPCGTPLHMDCQFESVSPSLTLCNRFDKESFIRVVVASSATYSFSFKTISSWGKVTKALDKSIETIPINLLLSISFFHCSVKLRSVESQPWYANTSLRYVPSKYGLIRQWMNNFFENFRESW